MSNNSKSEFLSISAEGGNIICPACGKPMSMSEFASYKLVFTPKARQALNNMVEDYVNFLTFFDNALLIHDQYGLDNVPDKIIPYDLNPDVIDKLGIYQTTYAQGVQSLAETQESLAVFKKISQLPKTEESYDKSNKSNIDKLLRRCYSLIYGQFQPYPYVASLFEIVKQQSNIQYAVQQRGKLSDEDITAFIEEGKNNQNSKESFDWKCIAYDLGDWSSLLKSLWHIAPGYARYINYLIDLWRELDNQESSQLKPITGMGKLSSLQGSESIKDKTFIDKISPDLPEIVIDKKEIYKCLEQFAHILNVFLRGGYIDFDRPADKQPEKSNSSTENRRPYKFGYNSIVQDWETLGKFITSFPVRQKFLSFWPADFSQGIRDDKSQLNESQLDDKFKEVVELLKQQSEPGSPVNANHREELLKKIGSKNFLAVVNSVVDFACSGRPMTLPNYVVKTKIYGGTSRNLRDMARDWITSSICGWCPGDQNAYSLVLLGGTGSGKSSIAQSGLVALSDSLSEFGYSLSYPGPVDQVIFDFYNDQHYQEHRMPDATEEGARYTLTLAVQKIEDPNSRVDLIFTDVAGEKIEAALLGGAEDPVVLGALSSANTFVYLFDFMAWQSFAAAVNSEKLKDNWQDFLKQKDKLRKESRAVRDSFEMLKAVVDKICQIRKQEGSENPYSKVKESNFILVLPKADLYWQPNKFLSDYRDELIEEGILQQSLSSGEKFYVSRGSSSPKLSKNIHELAELISNMTIDAIKRDFQKNFSVSDSSDIESFSLLSLLEKGVIEFLKKRFSKVYFLPISAQGYEPNSSEPSLGQADEAVSQNQSKESGDSDIIDGNKGYKLELPPAQVFCEFVFLIAAASAMESINK